MAATHDYGCGAAIYLLQTRRQHPRCAHGARRRERNTAFWSPQPISISIADYFTVRDGERVVYRPTCH